MKTYHKIKTLWRREDVKPCNMIVGKYSEPEFEMLKDIKWQATEKVDGTNIRVMWDGNKVKFGGKTDEAQMNLKLLDKLSELFGGESNEQKFEEIFESKEGVNTEICLYGEGFGGNIQKVAKKYGDFDFVLFDVRIGHWWLERDSIERIAKQLDVKVAPIVKEGTLQEISEFAANGFKSQFGDLDAEGIIARPSVGILKRNGERIITKLKHKDFQKLKKLNNVE